MTEKKSLRLNSGSVRPERDAAKAGFAQSFQEHRTAESEPMKALGIKLTASRHRKLKKAALERDTTMSELISEFIDKLEV